MCHFKVTKIEKIMFQDRACFLDRGAEDCRQSPQGPASIQEIDSVHTQ